MYVRLSLLLLLLVINSGCCFFLFSLAPRLPPIIFLLTFAVCAMPLCQATCTTDNVMRVHTKSALAVCHTLVFGIGGINVRLCLCLYIYLCYLVSRFDDLSVIVGILSIAATTAVIVIITNTATTFTTPSLCQCFGSHRSLSLY